MKTNKIITISALMVLCTVYLYYQRTTGAKNHPQQNQRENNSNNASVLLELRDTALKITPERLGLTLSSDTEVYGVILDEHTNKSIITLVSFQNGDVSLYNTVGQSYIGGGEIEKINHAAKKLVNLAQSCLSDAEKADSTPIPDFDGINIYLLTKKGIFKKQLTNNTLNHSQTTWNKLLDERNNIMQEYAISAKEYKERASKAKQAKK